MQINHLTLMLYIKNMPTSFFKVILCLLLITIPKQVWSQSAGITITDVKFQSQGITLSGSVFMPKQAFAAVVVVHGSDPVKREAEFAKRLATQGIAVFTYDKRGVGESGGVYVGPSVGTNNISTENLNLLAEDASSAVAVLGAKLKGKKLPIGLVGFSQAGWIIPIAATKNPMVRFMVLFSCPTITTLEQLRFQFYTDGNDKFWDTHTEQDAREHTKNDPDEYKFAATDPKASLNALVIPGLWLFGEKDIQIPVKLCIEQLNALKAKGKPFDYTLFPDLGHNTTAENTPQPFDIAVAWIKQMVLAKK